MPYDITLAHGALTDAPVWEAHKRGTNWFAAISKDPTAPNGLARRFAERARGAEFYYLVPDWLAPGAAVEFGADYRSSGGNVHRNRWYGVVVARTPDIVSIEPHKTPASAIKAAAALHRAHEEQAETPTGRALLAIEAAIAPLSGEQRAAMVALLHERHRLGGRAA